MIDLSRAGPGRAWVAAAPTSAISAHVPYKKNNRLLHAYCLLVCVCERNFHLMENSDPS